MRVVIVGGYAPSLLIFRGELLRAMVAAGHEVLAIAPEDDQAVRDGLSQLGVGYARVPLDRTGMSPLRDVAALLRLARMLHAYRADLILTYTVKPVVYGSLAAMIARVPSRAALITGAGSALSDGPDTRRWLSRLVRWLYRVALRQVDVVFFQNPDDEALFRRLGLVGARNRVHRVNGSGVDLNHFRPSPFPNGPMTFLMIGRLIRDKGVCEFVEAARQVRRTHPEARFQLLGPLDSNPSAISADQLDAWCQEGIIEYLGYTKDVRPFIAAAHVFVLPSYSEGTPRSVLEAMAMGRPIVTTDAPGCRETVVRGGNGILVRPRDTKSLADGMRRLIGDPESLETLGRESRRLAEDRFDVRAVNESIMSAMGLS